MRPGARSRSAWQYTRPRGWVGISELSVMRPEIDAVPACPNNDCVGASVKTQHRIARQVASRLRRHFIFWKLPLFFRLVLIDPKNRCV